MESPIIYIIDKQFEILNLPIRYVNLPEDGKILNGKKKEEWQKYYKFETEEDYIKWREWTEKECSIHNFKDWDVDLIDMVFGLDFKRKERV